MTKKIGMFLLCAVIIAAGITTALVHKGGNAAETEVKNADKIPVIVYHKVLPAGVSYDNDILIDEDTLDKQMKYLSDEGFTSLTMDEFYDWYTGKTEVPEKSVVICFDDGYYSTYYLAYPIMKKYGLAATVFCIGHLIDDTTAEWDPEDKQDHYVGMDVINRVREEYPRFGFESHTFNMHKKIDGKHPVNVFDYDQMVEDAEKNKEFGFRYTAYPWGDNNSDLRRAMEETGYRLGFGYKPFAYADRDDDPYAISRIRIEGKMKMRRFRKVVNGRESDYYKVKE